MTPEMVREVLYQGALVYWPNLTPKEYADAAREVVGRFDPAGNISLGELDEGIYNELVKRYGEPTDA